MFSTIACSRRCSEADSSPKRWSARVGTAPETNLISPAHRLSHPQPRRANRPGAASGPGTAVGFAGAGRPHPPQLGRLPALTASPVAIHSPITAAAHRGAHDEAPHPLRRSRSVTAAGVSHVSANHRRPSQRCSRLSARVPGNIRPTVGAEAITPLQGHRPSAQATPAMRGAPATVALADPDGQKAAKVGSGPLVLVTRDLAISSPPSGLQRGGRQSPPVARSPASRTSTCGFKTSPTSITSIPSLGRWPAGCADPAISVHRRPPGQPGPEPGGPGPFRAGLMPARLIDGRGRVQ